MKRVLIAAGLLLIVSLVASSQGLPTPKGDLDRGMGTIARDIRLNLRSASEFKYWLDQKTDLELTNIGYSAVEIANIRSTFNDLDKLNQIFLGTQTQAVPYDFRTFARRIWGTGGAF